MGSIRNTVVVAAMQVGVIVAGVLAAGICHNFWVHNNTPVPPLVAMLYRYGVAGFCIPLAWGTGAVVIQLRKDASEDVKDFMFWLGVLVLIALVAFVLYADVTPWFRAEWGAGGSGLNDDGG